MTSDVPMIAVCVNCGLSLCQAGVLRCDDPGESRGEPVHQPPDPAPKENDGIDPEAP